MKINWSNFNQTFLSITLLTAAIPALSSTVISEITLSQQDLAISIVAPVNSRNEATKSQRSFSRDYLISAKINQVFPLVSGSTQKQSGVYTDSIITDATVVSASAPDSVDQEQKNSQNITVEIEFTLAILAILLGLIASEKLKQSPDQSRDKSHRKYRH